MSSKLLGVMCQYHTLEEASSATLWVWEQVFFRYRLSETEHILSESWPSNNSKYTFRVYQVHPNGKSALNKLVFFSLLNGFYKKLPAIVRLSCYWMRGMERALDLTVLHFRSMSLTPSKMMSWRNSGEKLVSVLGLPTHSATFGACLHSLTSSASPPLPILILRLV